MNNRIRIARGTTANIATTDETLATGQPFYISDKNYLIVGKADIPIQGIKPITVRELAGWYDDNSNITPYKAKDYYIRPGENTNLEINAFKQLDLQINQDTFITLWEPTELGTKDIVIKKSIDVDAEMSTRLLVTHDILPAPTDDSEEGYNIGNSLAPFKSIRSKNLTIENSANIAYTITNKAFELSGASRPCIPNSTDTLPNSNSLLASNGVAFTNEGNDCAWLRLVSINDDTEEFELATSDNGEEPIYVRQYNEGGCLHQITLLDAQGITILNAMSATTISCGDITCGNIDASKSSITASTIKAKTELTAAKATFSGAVNAESGIVTTTLEVHTINLITT